MHPLTAKILLVFFILLLTVYGLQVGRLYPVHLCPQDEASAQRLEEMVNYFATYLGIRNYENITSLNSAADYIVEKLGSFGYVVGEQTYEVDGQKYRNIIASAAPEELLGEEIVLIGAHYDTMDNPGADDNASGIAVFLELAKLLSRDPAVKRMKFVAFTNEESPFFKTPNMGSQVYVRQAWDKGERLKLAVILEMVGYYNEGSFSQRYPLLLGPFFPNRANFIAMITNYPSRRNASKFFKLFRKSSDFPAAYAESSAFMPGGEWSDHVSFWQRDYPAVMLTDTAFYRNPNYHKPTDIAETLNYPKMARLVLGLQKALIALTKEP